MEELEKYGYGCIKSPSDLRNYRLSKVAKAGNLPDEFEVSHSNIKNQGSVGSCTAHSVSEIIEANDNIDYSVLWIYGYRPFGYHQDEGMPISQALKTVNKVGAIKTIDCPGNIEMPDAKKAIDSNLEVYKALASERKIASYARLNSYNEIKQAIYSNGKPIILSINIDENGLKLDKNKIAYVPTVLDGRHAVVCYGWNEKGLLIQNSWGKYWGNNGCFILPYEYGFNEAWLLTFNKSLITKPALYFLRELIQKLINLLFR